MIHIRSDFEGGSITVIDASSANNIQLEIAKDNKSCSRQWFYFSVETTSAKMQKIQILNANKASFTDGWKDYQAFASYDQKSWFRVNTDYKKGQLYIEHNAASAKVYYAYFVPYLAKQHNRQLELINNCEVAKHSIIGTTELGNNIDLISIGSVSASSKKVWIIARQHPGETMAQWIAEGLIQRLVEYFQSATGANCNTTFYLVPNMNPDGAALGNHRTNANGFDLNRQWADATTGAPTEVLAVKSAIQQTGIDLFIDVHGDEAIPHNFMMVEDNHPIGEAIKKELANRDHNFQTLYDYNTQNTGCGATTCGVRCGQQKATSYVSRQYSVPAILLEASFKNLAMGDRKQDWDHADCMKLGENLANICLELI